MKNILAAATFAALAGASGAANAADIYSPAAGLKDTPYVVAPSWTGFYAGVNGGGAFAQDPGNVTIIRPTGATASIPGIQPSGGFGGGQIGYNWQGGIFGPRIVLGIEADIQGSDINENIYFLPVGVTASRSSEVNVDYFGTVRGRLGYTFDNALVYATGGFAYGGVNYRVHNGVNTVIYTNDNTTETGYAAGGGLEYKLNSSWSIKAEYQYISLGSFDLRDPIVPAAHARDAEVDFHTVRAGLNYSFGHGYEPLK